MLSIEDYEDKIKELNEKIDKMTNTFFQINVLSDKIIEYYYNEKNFEELITTKEFYYELKFLTSNLNDVLSESLTYIKENKDFFKKIY